MSRSCILAIDQGTSSTKTIVFSKQGLVLARGVEPLKSEYRAGGLVEQDPEEIFRNVLLSVKSCLEDFNGNGGDTRDISVCGISNQRETFLLWDKNGQPLSPAVVWQCKRSVAICDELKKKGLEPLIREKTGLLLDPYFSGTKLIWLKDNLPDVKAAIESGNAYFGTIDTWLLFKLTKGERYCTDYTNASRTLLFNLSKLQWDNELLSLFGLTGLQLPELLPGAGYFGASDFNGLFKEEIKIGALAGDSHAAAFGEGCFLPGTAKATLGTGCSVLMNTNATITPSENGLVTTVCWSAKESLSYALEGIIVSCGATIEWLKNELGLLTDSRESEAMARSVTDNNGVYLVPAFSGLGAPHWQMSRKAAIYGLSFDCNKNHIVRAALESIAYQIRDVTAAMEAESGIQLKELMVNGGITSNQFVLQFLADLLECPVIHGGQPDVSAQGVAWLAGLQAGIYKNLQELNDLKPHRTVVSPQSNRAQMALFYKGWQRVLSYNS